MAALKTRAQLRDSVRRGLSQVPPIDDGTGAAGALPTRNPFPTNAQINDALDDAVAYFSSEGRLVSDPVPREISVDAVTANGPWHTSLRHIAPAGSVNDVLRVAWVPTSGNEQQLTPDNRANMDRTRKNYMRQAPGTPERYWVEGGSLMVWPAFSSAGTLTLMLGTALWSQSQTLDGEQIEIIPTDYHPLVVHKAISLICGNQPEDEELKVRKQVSDQELVLRFPGFLAWAQRRNRSHQPKMIPRRVRSGVMAGRR